jgi:hypothetical protein
VKNLKATKVKPSRDKSIDSLWEGATSPKLVLPFTFTINRGVSRYRLGKLIYTYSFIFFIILLNAACSSYVRPGDELRSRDTVSIPEEIRKPEKAVVAHEDIQPQVEAPPSVEVIPHREIPPPLDVGPQPVEEPEEDHVSMLIENLNSDNFDVQRRAVWALGATKDPRVIEPLILAFKVENRSIQLNAIDAVSRIGFQAVGPLIESIKSEDRAVRLNASKALRKIKDPEAVDLLVDALSDENPYVRLNAAKALGNIEEPAAVEPLILSLGDGNIYVRKNAAWSLGRIGDPRAFEPLMELLKDENVKVRISTPLLNDKNDDISKSALKALEMITGEDYRYDTEKWNEWWVDKREIYITDDSENPGYQ